MAKKDKDYRIKVPVYVSELLDNPIDLFGGYSFQDMLNKVKKQIDTYNISIKEIKNTKRNKTFEKHIKGIEYSEYPIGKTKGLLLKVTAFNTNLFDGFFEEEKKIKFTQNSKVGSDNNFMLLFPNIYGLNPQTYRSQWVILLYEDPNKENADIAGTAKLVLKKILDIDVKNVKLKTVIEKIKEAQYTPELNIKLTSLEHNVDTGIPEYKIYLFSSRTKTTSEYVYKDLPADGAIDIISKENSLLKRGMQVIKRVVLGKKEFKITQINESFEAEEMISEKIEEIYNADTPISEKELQEKVYNDDFVMEKLTPILLEYTKNIVE